MMIKNISLYRKIGLTAGFVAVFGIVLAFALNLERSYDDKLAAAISDSQNLALAVEHHAAATIQKTDLVLNRLSDEFSPEYEEKWLNPQKISNYLRTLQGRQPELKSLHIVKADGNVLYTLLDGGGFPLFLGEEAFFAAHSANPNSGLTLSDPAQGHADFGRNLILSRRLNNPDGSFAGIAAATISLAHFEGFYASLNPGNNASLALLNDKLAILARFPAGERFRGKSLAGGQLEKPLQKNPRGGTYSGVSQEDGVERIFSFRQVGDLPLYIHVGLAKQDFLGEWRRAALIDSAVIVVLVAFILALSYAWLRRPDGKREDVRGACDAADDVSELRRSEHLLKFENHVLEIVCGNASLNVTLELLCRGKEGILDEFRSSIENQALEIVSGNASLSATLDLLCRGMEEILAGSLCAIMLLDDDGLHLRHGAAPSLPSDYRQAIDGIAVGPAAGSCATAAYTGRQVIAGDIAHDPLWANDKKPALSHDLAACGATPIYSETDDLLGVFAVYYRTPYQPTPFDLYAVSRAVHLAGIAIRRKRAPAAME